ncbi:hypothetical protein [Vibrio mimicus]|uniref:hypothetical protein n=1 Tax=Vibrio mimicus TaxID=674 RepID=UPI00107079EB|nr:hypothetical protein [Vibrio mimicus]
MNYFLNPTSLSIDKPASIVRLTKNKNRLDKNGLIYTPLTIHTSKLNTINQLRQQAKTKQNFS